MAAEWTDRAEVSGRAMGLLFLTLFSAYWALVGIGVSGVEGRAHSICLGLVILVTVVLVYQAIRLIVDARRLPHNASPDGTEGGRRVGLQFGLVFGAEGVLVGVAASLLPGFGLDRLVIPVIAAIVGVHFLPLAALFHVPTYYVTGGVLIAAGVVGGAGVLLSSSNTFWEASVAFAAALSLWITGGVLIRQSRGLMSIARS